MNDDITERDYNALGHELKDYFKPKLPILLQELGITLQTYIGWNDWKPHLQTPYIQREIEQFRRTQRRVGKIDEDIVAWGIERAISEERELQQKQNRIRKI